MPVTTRYQHNAHLYETVLEEPLVLSLVLTHLSSQDAVNLKTTFKEPRFNDTIDDFLKDRKVSREKEKQDSFIDTVYSFIRDFDESRNMDIHYQIVQMNNLFEYLVDNRWFLADETFDAFQKVVENKLMHQLMEHPLEYAHHALYYLEVLFDIHHKVFVDEDNQETIEYVQDRDGKMITW